MSIDCLGLYKACVHEVRITLHSLSLQEQYGTVAAATIVSEVSFVHSCGRGCAFKEATSVHRVEREETELNGQFLLCMTATMKFSSSTVSACITNINCNHPHVLHLLVTDFRFV